MESYLCAWTPRNVYRRAVTAVAEVQESCAETLRDVLLPRLVRVLAPFPEARAAVVSMFLEMHRERVEVPGWSG
jgi:hypothetical protein